MRRATSDGAFAAYITGNVASNLIGRLISAAIADHLGLASNFYFFAAVNLAGAVLVYYTIAQTTPMMQMGTAASSLFDGWIEHLHNARLRAAFGIGFCILFAFIGTFTFVNFVLVRPPLSLGPMQLGFVYFVFLPSIVTTVLAGWTVRRLGTRPALWGALGLAAAGLPLLLFAQSRRRAFRHGADRSRDVLCAGDCDQLRQPGGHRRSRIRQRNVSFKLLCGGLGRDRGTWPGIRPVWMDGLRHRDCVIARCRCLPDLPP